MEDATNIGTSDTLLPPPPMAAQPGRKRWDCMWGEELERACLDAQLAAFPHNTKGL